MMSANTQTKRGNWEQWSVLVYREDSPKVTVAVPKDGKLVIVDDDAKPCLFVDQAADASCVEGYVAAALGSAERGVPSGDEQAGGQDLATFHNRANGTGTIELNGRVFKTFTDVKVLYAEPSIALKDGAVFSVFIQPASDTCAYRVLLRVTVIGDEPQFLDRVGVCRTKGVVRTGRLKDNTVARWIKVMWRDEDPRIDIAYWTGDEIVLTSTMADSCFFSPNVASECIDRVLPAELKDPPSRPALGGAMPPPKRSNSSSAKPRP
jgi:hypothetical protein